MTDEIDGSQLLLTCRDVMTDECVVNVCDVYCCVLTSFQTVGTNQRVMVVAQPLSLRLEEVSTFAFFWKLNEKRVSSCEISLLFFKNDYEFEK